MRKRVLCIILAVTISAFVGVTTNSYIHASNLTPIISILQNISIAVFTLAGIWIAYLYPESIAVYTGVNENAVDIGDISAIRKVEHLVLTIIVSAAILLCILFYNVTYALFSKNVTILENIGLVKFFAISFVVLLSIVETWVILSLIQSNITFIDKLHHARSQMKLKNKLGG